MAQDPVGPGISVTFGRERSLVSLRLAANSILQPGSLHPWVGSPLCPELCVLPAQPFKAFTKQIPKGCCQDTTFTTVRFF